MAKSGNYPHAAFCCKAAARCERALEDPTAEADLLVQGGERREYIGTPIPVAVPFLSDLCFFPFVSWTILASTRTPYYTG